MKRRRASRLDKEIAAAAAEANFQAGRAQFDDDEFSGDQYGGQSYYSASAGTHGAYSQPPMPHGQEVGMEPGAYPMQNTRRFSAGTTAGMAGFGAGGGGSGDPKTAYYGEPRSGGTAAYGYSQAQPQHGEYYSYPQGVIPAPLDTSAGTEARQPPLPDEKYDDPYGGEVDDYDDPPTAQQPQTAVYMGGVHRQDSSGTYDDEQEIQPRTLKVANE